MKPLADVWLEAAPLVGDERNGAASQKKACLHCLRFF
jgi:hypothetical protein